MGWYSQYKPKVHVEALRGRLLLLSTLCRMCDSGKRHSAQVDVIKK